VVCLLSFNQLGQQRHVDAESLTFSDLAAAADFRAQVVELGKARRGDETHQAGVDRRSNVVGVGQPVQAARYDRQTDLEQLGDAGVEKFR